MSPSSFTQRFSDYFAREVAAKAAKSLVDGAEIQIHIVDLENIPQESFVFTRQEKQNRILPGPARDPQLLFSMTAPAAEVILADPADDIGTIGVNIAKMIVAKEADKKISLKLKTGFLGLFSKGYFGIITAGGAGFASFMASRGLGGIGAIKEALKKLKS